MPASTEFTDFELRDRLSAMMEGLIEKAHRKPDDQLAQKDATLKLELDLFKKNLEKWKDSLSDGKQNVARLAEALTELAVLLTVLEQILAEIKKKIAG